MKSLAITSGKGGVGKTSLATNLGISLASAGNQVVLFDADLQLANVDIALGLQPEFNLQHVVAGEKTLREALTVAPAGLRVMTGGSAIPALVSAGPKRMAMFFDQLDDLAKDTDFLIFDTGAGLDNRVVRFVLMADEVLVVTTPDPTAVTDAYAMVKTIFRKKPEASISVAVNMVASEAEARAVFSTLANITESFLKKPISFAGSVRQDPTAAQATRSRKSFVISSKACPASEDVKRLAQAVAVDRWEPTHLELAS